MVKSEKLKGSTFTFTIKAPILEQDLQISENKTLSTNENNIFKKCNILVVDDNLVNQRVLTRQLNHIGFNCTVANNGMEALQFMENNVFDTVFMDIQMPVLDGLEATRRIRKREQKLELKRTPIIGLSGNARREHIDAAIDAGMDGYITKPYNKTDILDKLKQLALT